MINETCLLGVLKPAHIWGRRLRAHTWSSCYLSGGLTGGETRKFGGEEKRRSCPSGFRAQPWALPSPSTGPMSKHRGSANAAAVLQRVCPWGIPGASGPTSQVLLWPQKHSPILMAKTKPALVSLQGTARQTTWFCLHSFPPPTASPRGLSSRG